MKALFLFLRVVASDDSALFTLKTMSRSMNLSDLGYLYFSPQSYRLRAEKNFPCGNKETLLLRIDTLISSAISLDNVFLPRMQ